MCVVLARRIARRCLTRTAESGGGNRCPERARLSHAAGLREHIVMYEVLTGSPWSAAQPRSVHGDESGLGAREAADQACAQLKVPDEERPFVESLATEPAGDF